MFVKQVLIYFLETYIKLIININNNLIFNYLFFVNKTKFIVKKKYYLFIIIHNKNIFNIFNN